jgi:hypothetical protein
MSYANSKITAPVAISDIKNALGVATNKLSELCTSSNIKIMAKYKPVKQDNITRALTDTERAQVRYGVNIPYISYSNIFNSNLWTYTKPEKYFRQSDFNGYVSNASFVFSWKFDDKIRSNGSTTNNYEFDCLFTWTEPSTGVLGPSDLFTTAELKYYPTLVMYCATNNSWFCNSCKWSVGDLISKKWYGYGIPILMGSTPFYNLSEGSIIKVGMFLSPQQASNSTSISGSGLSLEYESGVATKEYKLIRSSKFDDVTVSITADYTKTITTSKVECKIKSITVSITANRNALVSNFVYRIKGSIQGNNITTVPAYFLISEQSVSKSNMSTITSNNYVTGYSYSKTFTDGWTLSTAANGNPQGSFILYALLAESTRTDAQWNASTECYEKGNYVITFS